MKLPIAIDFENRFYLFNLPDSAAQSATLFTGSSHYSERLFDDTDVCAWKHFRSFTYLKSSKASYVLGIAIFAYLCFLWNSSIVVLNGVVAAAAVFVVFIGKYYIEMLMSETLVFFSSFCFNQLSALLDYTYFLHRLWVDRTMFSLHIWFIICRRLLLLRRAFFCSLYHHFFSFHSVAVLQFVFICR